jgi:hypothetical protein
MRLKYLWPLLFSPLLLVAESGITEVFSKGAVHGQIKLFSYDIDKASDEDAFANAVGGFLKLGAFMVLCVFILPNLLATIKIEKIRHFSRIMVMHLL